MTYQHATATKMVATHCCICGLPLVDANSVEFGIGPVCRKRYIGEKTTTPEQFQLAFGHMLAVCQDNVLPVELATELRSLKDRVEAGRLMANKLVYFCSANREDRELIFRITPIFRALGYEELAGRLELDRVSLCIKPAVKDADRLEIHQKERDGAFERNLWYVPTMKIERHAKGRFRCRSFHKDHIGYVNALVEFHFGGKQAILQWDENEVGAAEVPQGTPAAVSAYRVAARKGYNSPYQDPQVTLTEINGLVEVRTPYDPSFVLEIKNIPGRKAVWDGQTFKCWAVPLDEEPTILKLLKQFFAGSLCQGLQGLFVIQ